MKQTLMITLILIASLTDCCLAQKENKRIIVVSGGGSRGAWGAGYAKKLTDSFGTYQVAFGTSTGSLMIPLIITNRFVDLKNGYTTVRQKDIFSQNPFNEKTGSLKFSAIIRAFFGSRTFGQSKSLRKLIDRFIPDEEYRKLRSSQALFGVEVVDFRTGEKSVVYSSDNDDPKVMKDWIWASANEPLFMSYYTNNDQGWYVDGGVRETIPVMAALDYAIGHNIHDIDVIINKPKDPVVDKNFKATSVFKGLLRLIEIWETEVSDDDILIGILAAKTENSDPSQTISVHLHYFPPSSFTGLNQHELLFDIGRMQALWDQGLQGIEDGGENFLRPSEMILSIPTVKNMLFNSRLKVKKLTKD